MDLQVKRAFNEIIEQFNNSFNLVTVSQIVYLTRLHKNKLNPIEIECLLQIPLNVLRYDVELVSSSIEWAEKNSHYFHDNIAGPDSAFTIKWREIFESRNFDLDNMVDFLEDIIADLQVNGTISDFWIRNVEVTLRDDVKLLSNSSFKASGNVFAQEIEKIIFE